MTEIPSPPRDEGTRSEPPAAQPWSVPGRQPGGSGSPGDDGPQAGPLGYAGPGFALPSQFAGPGGDPAGPGFPAPAPPQRRSRLRLISGIAVALVVLGAGIQHFAAAHGTTPGKIVLPGTLLGLGKYTGSGAQVFDSTLRHAEATSNHGALVHVAAVGYGNPKGRWFAVAGGGTCGSCAPTSARDLVKVKVAKGLANARSFSPGPNGGVLVCGSEVAQGGTVFECGWGDPKTAGDVAYFGGFASSLADAAAKTIAVRAAIEH